jgi:hypothetical protein
MKTDTEAFGSPDERFGTPVLPQRLSCSGVSADRGIRRGIGRRGGSPAGMRYRHVMSPNRLVGNIVSQGVKSFARGRGPKLLVTVALDLGARVAEVAVWKFTPSLEDFPQDGIRNMWLRHRLTLQRQSVLRPRGIVGPVRSAPKEYLTTRRSSNPDRGSTRTSSNRSYRPQPTRRKQRSLAIQKDRRWTIIGASTTRSPI